MLAEKFTQDTEFPLPGSRGFIRDTCEEVRIIQDNNDGTLLVGNVERFTSRNLASGSKRVARTDLFERVEQALHGTLNPPMLGRYAAPRVAAKAPSRSRRGGRSPRKA